MKAHKRKHADRVEVVGGKHFNIPNYCRCVLLVVPDILREKVNEKPLCNVHILEIKVNELPNWSARRKYQNVLSIIFFVMFHKCYNVL